MCEGNYFLDMRLGEMEGAGGRGAEHEEEGRKQTLLQRGGGEGMMEKWVRR